MQRTVSAGKQWRSLALNSDWEHYMFDLNDFYYFHTVVIHQGFSAASRKTGIPKSTLSKHIARLEERLQVRLLERSTRRLRTTDLGQAIFDQCQTMLAGVEAAHTAVAQARGEPTGIVRVSCPQGLIQSLIADVLPKFMTAYPQVRVQMKVMNRRADLIEDNVDVALRAKMIPDADPALIVRALGQCRLVLAATNDLAQGVGTLDNIHDLANFPLLSKTDNQDDDTWELIGPSGESHTLHHRPRLICSSSFDVLITSALAGLGIALLPEHICRTYFASGELVRVLPEWHATHGTIHAVFSTRKGLVPAVREFIDFLAAEVKIRVAGTAGQLKPVACPQTEGSTAIRKTTLRSIASS